MNGIKQLLQDLDIKQEQCRTLNSTSVKTRLIYLLKLEKIIINEIFNIIKLQTEQGVVYELLSLKQKVLNEVSKIELKITVNDTSLEEKDSKNKEVFSNLFNKCQENLSNKNLVCQIDSSVKSKTKNNSTEGGCHSCNDHHPTLECPKLKELTAISRTKFADNKKLCYQCLEKHKINHCKLSKCSFCNYAHHITLCWKIDNSLKGHISKGQNTANTSNVFNKIEEFQTRKSN